MPAKKTTAQFIEDAVKVHGERYDYSLVEYVNNKAKVKIICKEHGVFEQVPNNHLSGVNCPRCAGSGTHNVQSFVEKAKAVHGDMYDYTQSAIVNDNTRYKKVIVTCKKHGSFIQSLSNHLSGAGCINCYRENKPLKLSTMAYISRAKEKHGNRYDYSLTEYRGRKHKVKIICPTHGVFKQGVSNHLRHGCPKCSASGGEVRVSDYLKKMDILFESEKRFEKCRDKNPLPFDFYIADCNLLIEYDGRQHFESMEFFGGEKGLKSAQKRDAIKTKFAERHNIRLLRIPYTEYDRIEEILSEALKLEYQPLQLSLFAA
jgi:very-short-patch-repair endonuclease